MFGLLLYAAELTFAGILPGSQQGFRVLLALVAAVLSVASLYAHELAHALVAIRFGIPVRTISLFLLGGMAHISRESPSPRAEMLIALAGPFTSLAIGTASAVLAGTSWDAAPAVGAVAMWLALTNLPIAVFNLVPAYPLDGGRVLRAVLWFAGQDRGWGSVWSARAGQMGAAGLLFGGLYGLFSQTGGTIANVWLLLLAWFMYGGAVGAHRAAVFQDALRRLSVASVMQRQFGRVEAGVSLQELAEGHLLQDSQAAAARGELEWAARPYGVYMDEHLVGLISLSTVRRVPSPLWRSTTVERVMVPIERAPTLEPDTPALRAFQLLVEEGWDQLPVVVENRLLGLVSRADLARAVERAGRST